MIELALSEDRFVLRVVETFSIHGSKSYGEAREIHVTNKKSHFKVANNMKITLTATLTTIKSHSPSVNGAVISRGTHVCAVTSQTAIKSKGKRSRNSCIYLRIAFLRDFV
jgi:ornithine cyclodeaminase/alanine dehydrogenase-like protein (mu-crystallin family)